MNDEELESENIFEPDPPRPKDPGDDLGMRLLLPVGRSGWAIVSGYLGLFSFACFPMAPFAFITGWLAIREMRRDPKKHGMGRAVFGIIMGVLGSIALAAVIIYFVAESQKRR